MSCTNSLNAEYRLDDIENLGTNLFKITQGSKHLKNTQKIEVTEVHRNIVVELVDAILANHTDPKHMVNKNIHSIIQKLCKKYELDGKIRLFKIGFIIRQLIDEDYIDYKDFIILNSYLMAKKMRSDSGVLVVAVMTMPGDFSCAYNCYYCPDHEGMPRSYDPDAPSAIRAHENGFDMVKEFNDRASTYAINGHNVDKVEVIILGGTWDSYPIDYQERVINELYYAANVFYQVKPRPMLSMKDEQKLNETALCKIVGLTIETRPDQINPDQLKRCLSYGVTRIQIGIQHTDNKILKKINRQCTIEDAYRAIYLIKEANIKVQAHWMPNLPGSDPNKDREMFDEINTNQRLSCDDIKLYPTIVTTPAVKKHDAKGKIKGKYSSVLEQWHDEGTYVPYSIKDVKEVLIHGMTFMGEEVRISRIFRDIPQHNTISGCEEPNMQEEIIDMMKDAGLDCPCLRCHEVKTRVIDEENITIKVKTYEASNSIEHFISAVSYKNNDLTSDANRIVHGFIRLRIPHIKKDHFIKELEGCALIRELHVYGRLIPTFNLDIDESEITESTRKYLESLKNNQHRGIGKMLVKKAEEIANSHGYTKYAIISGIGVREYYRRQGYILKGPYMIKTINPIWNLMQNKNFNSYKCNVSTEYSGKSTLKDVVKCMFVYMALMACLYMLKILLDVAKLGSINC